MVARLGERFLDCVDGLDVVAVRLLGIVARGTVVCRFRLVDVGEWPHVSIRVLPFSAGMHRATVVGRFVVFDFPADGRREPEPSIVYCESLTGALYLDKEHEAETFKAVWKSIDRLALDEAESMVMIRAAAEEYTHDQLRADRVAQEHPQRRGR